MADVVWLDDLEMDAWRALLTAHRRLVQRLDAELQATQHISASDYGVLVELSEAGGQMRMTELADRILISPSGLTRRLDTLVDQGLVDRVRCTQDRRGSYAVLTDAGRARLVEAAPDHVEQVRRHFVALLDRDELRALAQALGKVAENCSGHEECDPGP